MPVYDYTCSNCGHVTEVIHGINDHGPNFCPECGAEGAMRKGFATPAVHFKGSGWAKKDRASSSSAAKTRSTRSDDTSSVASGGSGDGSSAAGGDGGSAAGEDGGSAAGGSAAGGDGSTRAESRDRTTSGGSVPGTRASKASDG